MKRSVLIAGLAVGLSACAAHVPWVSSRVPKSQWDKDWSACKRAAEYNAGGGRDWDEPSSDPWAAYDRDKAKQSIGAEVSSCMIGLGYVPAEKKK